jgi:iron complex outermembrane recepter protein
MFKAIRSETRRKGIEGRSAVARPNHRQAMDDRRPLPAVAGFLRTALLVALCASPTVGMTQQQAQETGLELQTIVVTASKRAENLQEVPLAVTALSGASLESQGVTDFSDYLGLVPGLADYSGGAEGHGTVILRGLNTGYYSTSATVAFYVDDTPYSASSSAGIGTVLNPAAALIDIDRIEVLKGPQGTLYGASALGGLIKMVSNKPNVNSESGVVRTDFSTVDGGGQGYGIEGTLNLPLVAGSVALRASLFDRETPGYMTNQTLDSTDRGLSRKKGGKFALRWAASNNLDVELSAFLQDLRVHGFTYEFVNLQTLEPVGGNYTYQSPYDPSFHTTLEIYNLAINYTFADFGTLLSSTSYSDYHDAEIEDYTPFAAPVFNSFAPAPVPPNAAMPLVWGPTLNKFTEELRFTSNRIGHVEWLAGLYFTNERTTFPNTYTNAIPPSTAPIPGPSGLVLSTVGQSPSTYKEEAVFGDLTYYLNNQLDLTVGGRYSHNSQDVGTGSTGFAGGGGVFTTISSSSSDFTYQAALRWQVSKELNAYARVATGYRPGGPQRASGLPAVTSFDPDTVTNYELGTKGLWLNGTLSANLAIYYMDWHDIQISSITPNGLGVIITNGGKAVSQGVDFETQYAPTPNFAMRATVAYTDAALRSVPQAATAVVGAVAGDRLPYTPRWSGSLTADYLIPLKSDLSASVGATYRYQGSRISDYPGDPLNTGVNIPSYETFDIRTALDWRRYKVEFLIQNLANKLGFQTVVDQRFSPAINPPVWAAVIPPRTFVLALSAKF